MKIKKALKVYKKLSIIFKVAIDILVVIIANMLKKGYLDNKKFELSKYPRNNFLRILFCYWDRPIIELVDYITISRSGLTFKAYLKSYKFRKYRILLENIDQIDQFMSNKKVLKFFKYFDILTRNTPLEFERPEPGEYTNILTNPFENKNIKNFMDNSHIKLGDVVNILIKNGKNVPKNWRKIVKKFTIHYMEFLHPIFTNFHKNRIEMRAKIERLKRARKNELNRGKEIMASSEDSNL